MLTPYHTALMSIFGNEQSMEKLLGLPAGHSDKFPQSGEVRRLLQSTAVQAFFGSQTDSPANANWPQTLAHGYGS